jgi:hypothetical protein
VISPNNLLAILAVLAGTLTVNFISIHLMTNLILYRGSSKGKSFNIAFEFALLTTTLLMLAIVVDNLILGAEKTLTPMHILYFTLASDGLLVGILKWWYVNKKYETTYLNAFIITEWLHITLAFLLVIASRLILG